MNTDKQLILFTIGALIVIVLGMWFYDSLIPIGMSPIHIWGVAFLTIVAFGMIFTEVLRGKSPQFINRSIYTSINDKEIKTVPWNNDLVQIKEGEQPDPMMMAVIPLGGINYWSFNPDSAPDKPLVIQPYEDLQKVGSSYHSVTTLLPYSYDEVPPDLRHFCERTLGKRFTDCKTILFGLTSHIDGSTNPHNERLMFEKSKQNTYIKQMEDERDSLYKELRRKNKEKEKTIFVKNSGTISDED
jgi:hypothetical protein